MAVLVKMYLNSGNSEHSGILKMMEHNYRSLKAFKHYVLVLTLVLVILFFFPALGLSRSKSSFKGACFQVTQTYDQEIQNRHWKDFNYLDKHWEYTPFSKRCSYRILSKNYSNRYDSLSPEEKTLLKKRYQEWESLPERKRQMLRRRMKKYQQLPPQERERFRQRHRQLQELSPDERYKIREKLQKWDRLAPDEKEQIRQRFRRP
jgi:Protein of unknown function (DUF3106)